MRVFKLVAEAAKVSSLLHVLVGTSSQILMDVRMAAHHWLLRAQNTRNCRIRDFSKRQQSTPAGRPGKSRGFSKVVAVGHSQGFAPNCVQSVVRKRTAQAIKRKRPKRKGGHT
mmetsp:Transcript_13425/g.19349  ORF Transcript_13425/g.19349 Transcript_13425/m.19349 type:complete len:113 (-) Transcript_13425:398-736(-)